MKKGNVTFKAYTMEQPSLLPPDLGELISEEHLVRVVNRVVEAIDLEPLLAKYKGGGTSSYHPRMMLKVLVYACSEKIFTSRRYDDNFWKELLSGSDKRSTEQNLKELGY